MHGIWKPGSDAYICVLSQKNHSALSKVYSWVRYRLKSTQQAQEIPDHTENKGAVLDLLFLSRDGLMGNVMVAGCLGHSDHEIVEFKIFDDMGKTVSSATALAFGRTGFRLLKAPVSKVPWESAFEGIQVHKCRPLFKSHLLRAQEQAIPMCWKSSKQGRRLAGWRRFSRCSLTRAGYRGTITSLLLLATLFLTQARMPLAFLATWTHCWLMFSQLSTSTPRSFCNRQLSSHSSPSLQRCMG